MLRDAVLHQRTEGIRMRVSKPQKVLRTGEWVDGSKSWSFPQGVPREQGRPLSKLEMPVSAVIMHCTLLGEPPQ